jgi:hypothetical protein
MGRVTFQDSKVIRRVNQSFVATWRNVHPGYRVEHLEGARFEEVKRIPNGQASENVVTLFCTAGGELLHVVPGHWKPKDYLKEIDFALSVARAVARAGPDAEARRKAVIDMHRARLARLDRTWGGGALGRMVIESAQRRQIDAPLRRASEVRGVEEYALQPVTDRLAQKLQRLQQAVQQRQREGQDVRPIAELMQGFEPLVRSGRIREAEARVDRSLGLLGKKFVPDDAILTPPMKAFSPTDLPESIRRKMARASVLAEAWKREGKDLTPVARVMNALDPLLRQGRFQEAESVLDRGLQLMGGSSERADAPPESPTAEPAWLSSPAPNRLTVDALKAEIDALRAPGVAWRETVWKSCLLDGLKESRSKGKPVLLWVFIDRPADDRRC